MKAELPGLLVVLCLACGTPFDETYTGSEPVGEDVSQHTEAIVGGTKTFARPEVGFLGSCTATMVTSQAFVTAAHCIGFALEADGGTFLMERSATESRTIDIWKTYSQHDELGGGDLAVGFLSQSAPSWTEGATMVRNGDFGSSERGTRMGYGCVETTHQSGQGVKRYRETTTGNVTDVTCPMDSGGPHFKGALGDNGPIYSVASKYDAGPDPGFDTNAFVDAEWVEAMIRWRFLGLEVGLDRYGFDYAWVDTSSAAQCDTSCRQDPKCQAFTYVTGEGCNLKTVMGSSSPNRTTTSGPGVGPFYGDVVGSDYAWYPVARYDVCEADCARDSACQAWTFNSGTCYLKNAKPEVTACNVCRSGYRKNALEPNIDRPGRELRALTTASATQCASECAKHDFCDSFSFSPTKRCTLKFGTPAPVFAPGHVSGIRGGIQYNVNRPGSVYKSFDLPNGHERKCQAECLKDSKCKAWSYYMAIAGGGPTCYLRDAVPARDGKLGVMSGVPGMEFF